MSFGRRRGRTTASIAFQWGKARRGVLLPLWGDGSGSFLLLFGQINYLGFAVGKIAAKTCRAKLFYQMVRSHRKKFF